MAIAVNLKKGTLVARGYVGFSWTVFWFGFLVPLSRGDIKWFFAMMFAMLCTVGMSNIVFCFIYNKIYTRNLMENKGYLPADDYSRQLLIQAGLVGAYSETFSSYHNNEDDGPADTVCSDSANSLWESLKTFFQSVKQKFSGLKREKRNEHILEQSDVSEKVRAPEVFTKNEFGTPKIEDIDATVLQSQEQPCIRCGKQISLAEQWCPYCSSIQIRNNKLRNGQVSKPVEKTPPNEKNITLSFIALAGICVLFFALILGVRTMKAKPSISVAPVSASNILAGEETAWDLVDWSSGGQYEATDAKQNAVIFSEPAVKSRIIGNVECQGNTMNVTIDKVKVLRSGSKEGNNLIIHDVWWHVREPFEGWLMREDIGLWYSDFLGFLYGIENDEEENDPAIADKSADEAANKSGAQTPNEKSHYVAQLKVKADILNVRSGPSQEYPVVGKLKRGQVITTEAFEPDAGSKESGDVPVWFRIALQDGKKGWVYSEFLTEIPVVLEGNALLVSIQSGYLRPYTAEEKYPCIKEAFEHFFDRAIWELSSNPKLVVFKGVAYINKRPARFVMELEKTKEGEAVVSTITINDTLCYSRLEEMLPGMQNLAVFLGAMFEQDKIDLINLQKYNKRGYRNTVDIKDFLAVIYLSK